MPIFTIKGREYTLSPVRDSYDRRAQQYYNALLAAFKKVGLTEDDLDVSIEPRAMRNLPASVSFWLGDRHCHYSFSGCTKFVENLQIVLQVLERELAALVNEETTLEEFHTKFAEDKDVTQKRAEAREILGLAADARDMTEINKRYKDLAKQHHPDIGGDTEMFKKINNAHKTLKRELE